jgi:hypothetical protein
MNKIFVQLVGGVSLPQSLSVAALRRRKTSGPSAKRRWE